VLAFVSGFQVWLWGFFSFSLFLPGGCAGLLAYVILGLYASIPFLMMGRTPAMFSKKKLLHS
jgi:K+-transporting ATPase A subunit